MKTRNLLKLIIGASVAIAFCLKSNAQVQITGLTATASAYDGSSNTPDKAVDGNQSTQWVRGNGSGADWLQVTVPTGQYYVLSQINVYHNGALGIDNFRIQLIKDGSVLQTIPATYTYPLNTFIITLTQAVNAVKILGENMDDVEIKEVQLLAPYQINGSGDALLLRTTSTTGNNYIKFANSTTDMGIVGYGNSGDNILSITNYKNEPLTFGTNSTPRMWINANGNVSIGAQSNIDKLVIFSGSASTYAGIRFGRTSEDGALGVSGGGHYVNYSGAGDIVLRNTIASLHLLGMQGITLGVGNSGSANKVITISATGKVGIGAAPTANDMLFVNGNINANSFSTNGTINSGAITATSLTVGQPRITSTAIQTSHIIFSSEEDFYIIGHDGEANRIVIPHDGPVMIVGNQYSPNALVIGKGAVIGQNYYTTNTAPANGLLIEGNVLIGKTTQTNSTYKLEVEGKIRATEIVVNSTGADFVFDKNYKPLNLSELEQYVNINKHLPDVPSASEMQTNGMNVSDMQTTLLQKVEELTLYMIELKKENNQLKKEIENIKNK
jgi:hypothetical protein